MHSLAELRYSHADTGWQCIHLIDLMSTDIVVLACRMRSVKALNRERTEVCSHLQGASPR